MSEPDDLTNGALDRLLDRYLAGECDAAESAQLASLLAALRVTDDEESDRSLASLRAVFDASRVARPSLDARADAFVARLASDVPPSVKRPTLRPSSRPMPHSARRASRVRQFIMVGALAAVTMAIIAGVRVWRGASVERVATRQTFATARAERATVTLSDGSRVTLAPETELRFTVTTAGARTAELRGQAFFAVTADPRRTFQVLTGGVTTRVLGTAFSVRHYAGDQNVSVAVASGRVRTGGAALLTLDAGAAALLTDSTATPVASTNDLIGWTQGRLRFTNASVPDVLQTVGRWYGYEFRLADSTLAKRHVTIGLATDAPRETLRILKDVLGVTMTFDGPVVTLRPATSSRDASPAVMPAPVSRNTVSISQETAK